VVHALIREGRRQEVKPGVIGRTVAPATAAALTHMMEQVVERGTATQAQIEGYTIAGKTGTTSKLVDGRYSHDEYYASFVGFLPSRQPAATIIVVIDSPRDAGYYGGPIAGPIFRKIAEATLRHFGIPPTLNAPRPVLVTRRVEPPPIQLTRNEQPTAIVTAAAPDASHSIPDLRGLNARDALRRVTVMGLTARLHGDGVVAAQAPPPGAAIEPGTVCELWLERGSTIAVGSAVKE
jgi:cell division protein FtsI (penicillin-binding protein 3)